MPRSYVARLTVAQEIFVFDCMSLIEHGERFSPEMRQMAAGVAEILAARLIGLGFEIMEVPPQSKAN